MGRHRRNFYDPTVVRARSFTALKGWPQEALGFLHREFARKRIGAGLTWDDLLSEMKKRWGIVWNDSSLSRYYAYWHDYIQPNPRDIAPVLGEIQKTLVRIEALLRPRATRRKLRRKLAQISEGQ